MSGGELPAMNDPRFDPYRPPQASLGSDRGDHGSRELEIPEGSPFLTIWTRPRGTIRGAVETDPNQHFWFLGILFGIHRSFDQAIGFRHRRCGLREGRRGEDVNDKAP